MAANFKDKLRGGLEEVKKKLKRVPARDTSSASAEAGPSKAYKAGRAVGKASKWTKKKVKESYEGGGVASKFTFGKVLWIAILTFAWFWFRALGPFIMWPVLILIGMTLLKIFLGDDAYSKIKKPFMSIVLLALLIYGGYFMYTIYSTGVWKGPAAALGEIGIEKRAGVAKAGLVDYIKNPEKLFYDYYTWKNPDIVEEEPQKGIEFSGVDARKDFFNEGEPVVIYGSAKVSSMLESDVTTTFGCNVDDVNLKKEGKMSLRGIEGSSITVYAGYDEFVDFICEFEDGFEITSLKEGTEEKTIQSFVVDMEGSYKGFSTTSVLKIYNLANEKLMQLKDPFEGIKEPLLDKNNKMRSQCIAGCGLTKLSLKTSKQPLTEIGTYTLALNLKKDVDWYGDVQKLQSIEVGFPVNFNLIGCENFGGNNILDGGDSYLHKLNENLKAKKKDDASDFVFYCDFKIIEPRELIGFDEVMVRATYDYMIDKKKIVNILEATELDGESIE